MNRNLIVVLVVLVLGLSINPGRSSDNLAQEIHILTIAEERRLARMIADASGILEAEPPLTIDHVQTLYNIALSESSNQHATEIAGIAFGDHLQRSLGWDWVAVRDQYGEEISLSPSGYSIVIHPISMIQKRVNESSRADMSRLSRKTIEFVRQRLETNGVDKR